jgi:hypothetical protein
MTAIKGFYVDDMSPQPDWPEDHVSRVAALLDHLETHPDCHLVRLDWSGGIVFAARHG